MPFHKYNFILSIAIGAITLAGSLWALRAGQDRQPAAAQESEREARQRKLAEMRPQPVNDAKYARSLMEAAARPAPSLRSRYCSAFERFRRNAIMAVT